MRFFRILFLIVLIQPERNYLMSANHIAKSKQKSAVAEALASCQGLIKASLCRTRVTCGKPSCRCAKNPRFRHTALTFTYKQKGRSMGLHVPKNMEAEARRAAADYQKLKTLVQKISDLNLKKFRRKIQTMKTRSPACAPRAGKSVQRKSHT